MVKVLLLGDNDLCAQEAAQQTFVMMLCVGRDVAAMVKPRLALVAVDGFRILLQRVDVSRRQ